MKIVHFILGKADKNRANGVNQVIAGLGKYCSRLGAEVRMIGKAETVEYEGEHFEREGFVVEAYAHWDKPLTSALEKAIEWADIVHLHGTYSPWNVRVANMCDAKNKPYVVTLHDGLAPERSKAKGSVKKFLFHRLFQKKHLGNAAGIHVLTEEEATDLFAVAQPQRVFCIPNGIDLDEFPPTLDPKFSADEQIRIGYLGRLSPEKNLDALCEGVGKLKSRFDIRLELAGPISAYAENLVLRYGEGCVELVGAKFGEDKAKFIRDLDLFVHPSLCDVFSIAGMEVLAMGTPLLITRTSKASYFFNRDAFFMCEPTAFGLANGIKAALEARSNWPDKTENGRQLVEDTLNWEVAARRLLSAYASITGEMNET